MGVDAVAFVSMAAALALGQTLAGVVVAIMYAGGGVLEDFAVGRAERDLKALVDRAPRVAHRKKEGHLKTCQLIKSLSEMNSSCTQAKLSPLTDRSQVDRHASLKARPYPIDFGGEFIQLVMVLRYQTFFEFSTLSTAKRTLLVDALNSQFGPIGDSGEKSYSNGELPILAANRSAGNRSKHVVP
jgi:hypothetical protein